MLKNDFDIKYKNIRPTNYKNYNIGIIGAGNIIENSHLPTYIEANLNITNIYDLDFKKSSYLKEKFKIKKISNSLIEFLEDKNINIVDIAVPAEHNKDIFFKVLEYDKNILIQKPLSNNILNAEEILNKYRKYNLKANVNHQMRYSPVIRAANYLIKNNYLGNLKEFNFFTKRKTDWSLWPWLEKIDYPELWYNSIHYIDSIRYLFGEPIRLNAKLLKDPDSNLSKPTRTYINFEFDENLYGNLNISHSSLLLPEKWSAGFVIEGSKGLCKGIISSMIGNGQTFKDKISLNIIRENGLFKIDKELEGRWFSESFKGPMYSLIDSIESNKEPETNIEDALKTIKLLDLSVKSNESGEILKCY